MIMDSMNELTNGILNEKTILEAGSAAQGTTALIAMIAVGLLICFFGLKLIKVLMALAGLLTGASVGVSVAVGFGITGITFAIVVIGCAAVLGAMSFFLYKFGIFMVALLYTFGTCSVLIQPLSLVPLIICIVAAVIIATLAVIYTEPLTIVITAVSGGVTAGSAALSLTGISSNVWIGYGIGAVFAVIGLGIQFMMHSKKIGKKEKVYAKKVKEEVSRESEVEKARRLLDDEPGDEAGE